MIWYVALGSAVGGASRFLVTIQLQRLAGTTFPAGTLVVNVVGSLLLGFLFRLGADAAAPSPEMRLMLTTGFCGGFTTFSTFSLETVQLFQDGHWGRGAAYVAASVGLGLAAMIAGMMLGQAVSPGPRAA